MVGSGVKCAEKKISNEERESRLLGQFGFFFSSVVYLEMFGIARVSEE